MTFVNGVISDGSIQEKTTFKPPYKLKVLSNNVRHRSIKLSMKNKHQSRCSFAPKRTKWLYTANSKASPSEAKLSSGGVYHHSEPKVSTITHLTCLDFFDVKHSKKLNNSNHRYNIRDISKTSYQKNWIPEITNQTAQLSNWLMTLSSDQEIESPNNFFIKNIEIKSNRINTAKLLRRDDTSTLSEGRSVVNTALETYSKRVKVKTLAGWPGSEAT